jgi:hypothetical protein
VLTFILWVDVVTIRGMVARRLGARWWVALALLLLAGGSGGAWGMLGEYHPTEHWRFFGFPFPVGGFHLEGDDWVDYVSPLLPFIALANLTTFLLVSVLPLSVAYAVWGRKTGTAAGENGSIR